MKTSLWLVALLAALGIACTSAPGTADSAAADSTDDHAKHIEAIASKQYGEQVDGVFGAFARGESAVYRGTFGAHDNERTIASQAATATLGMVDGSLTLRVESAVHQYVDFVQSSDGTMVSMIEFDTESGGMLSQCKDCIPSFSPLPSKLQFTNVEVDGHYYDDAESPFAITATTNLTRVPVRGITYADLETTNAAYGFAPDGKGMLTRHVEDIVDEALPTKPGMYACWLRTNYALDQWVDPTDITKYGTRDFKVEAISTCCLAPDVCAGGGMCVPPSQTKSFTTGVGAEVKATTTTEITSASGAVERKLTVSYRDAGKYFADSSKLNAVAIVHRQGMNGDAPVTLKWSLANGAGTVTLPDAAIITAVDFAFSDADGHRWDSNDSRNYTVSF